MQLCEWRQKFVDDRNSRNLNLHECNKAVMFSLLSAKISGNLCHLLYKFRSPANATQTLNKRAQLDKHLTALMLGAQAHHTAQCDCATVMREYASTRVCTVFDAKTNYSHLGAAHTKPLPRVEFNQPNNTNAHSTPTIRGHRHTHTHSRRERSKLNHLSAFGGALTHTPLFPFTHSVFVVLNYTLSQSQAPTSTHAGPHVARTEAVRRISHSNVARAGGRLFWMCVVRPDVNVRAADVSGCVTNSASGRVALNHCLTWAMRVLQPTWLLPNNLL